MDTPRQMNMKKFHNYIFNSHKSTVYEFGINRPRGRPRNRWQDEVREDGKTVRGKVYQDKVFNRQEWKKVRVWQQIVAFCTCHWNELITVHLFMYFKEWYGVNFSTTKIF
jgi:hypothetical protein